MLYFIFIQILIAYSENLIRRGNLRHLIWVCTVCTCPTVPQKDARLIWVTPVPVSEILCFISQNTKSNCILVQMVCTGESIVTRAVQTHEPVNNSRYAIRVNCIKDKFRSMCVSRGVRRTGVRTQPPPLLWKITKI